MHLSLSSIERVAGRRAEVPKSQEEINCQWQTFFFLLYTKLKEALLILCRGHLALPWANQSVFFFLVEMLFLSYVNETVYLLWNLSFFKMVPPKTNIFFLNLGLIMAQQTSIHVHCFMKRDDTPPAILSQTCMLWERGLVKPPQPRRVSYLISNRHKTPH